jgi:hypothetical protein
MAHAAFVHSKPVRIMTSLTSIIPETVSGEDGITRTISCSNQKNKK